MSEKLTLSATWNGPTDIICNGFSLKKTILEILREHEKQRYLDDADIDEIAEEIIEAFAVKLRMKQG